MTDKERKEVIEEIKTYLRQLGLVSKEDTVRNPGIATNSRQIDDSECNPIRVQML